MRDRKPDSDSEMIEREIVNLMLVKEVIAKGKVTNCPHCHFLLTRSR